MSKVSTNAKTALNQNQNLNIQENERIGTSTLGKKVPWTLGRQNNSLNDTKDSFMFKTFS